MKVMRILLIAAFMLAGRSTTAQAASVRVGFVALLSKVDARVPIEIQTQQAMNRLMPALLAAQRAGQILEFEPELSAGILKFRYSAAANMTAAALSGRTVYADINAAAAAVPHTQSDLGNAPIRGRVGTLTITPYFELELYNDCFHADSLGANSHVVGKLLDTTSRVVAVYQGVADGSGVINTGCFSWAGPYANLVPGYRVNFTVYTPTHVYMAAASSPVPAITFTTVTKASAIAGGVGPAGKSYVFRWDHHSPLTDMWTSSWQIHTVSGAGTWTDDFPGQFVGWDNLSIFVHLSQQFTFKRHMGVPHIDCALGGNYCLVQQFAFKPTTLSIVHGGTTYTFSGTSDSGGSFFGYLLNAGNPTFLVAGDKVSGTLIPQYALPNLTASINYATNVVSGNAPALTHFELWGYVMDTSSWYETWRQASSFGTYWGTFGVDLQPIQAINIEVAYVDPVTGNATALYKAFGP
jgi:hypothetical protein